MLSNKIYICIPIKQIKNIMLIKGKMYVGMRHVCAVYCCTICSINTHIPIPDKIETSMNNFVHKFLRCHDCFVPCGPQSHSLAVHISRTISTFIFTSNNYASYLIKNCNRIAIWNGKEEKECRKHVTQLNGNTVRK